MNNHAHVLIRPIISEKSLSLASNHNAYTFEVQPTATKQQISQAVEEMFGVKVVAINTVMRGRSLQRTGRRRVITLVPRKKKAVLTLAAGQSISLFDLKPATEGEAK